MSATEVYTPLDYEDRLRSYLFERSEEGRAVRVGEKEVSEQAEIVRRYADLFTREQLDALRGAEESASGDEREQLYRLRKTCESGLIAQQLAERTAACRLRAARLAPPAAQESIPTTVSPAWRSANFVSFRTRFASLETM